VRPWLAKLKAARGVVFDNAGPHKKLAEFLSGHGVNVIAHPPHSPDLNLAEDVIRDLKHDAEQDGLPLTNHELLRGLKTAVSGYKMTRLHKHVATYQSRVAEIIKRKGLPSGS
jgi:hypothetical protein